MTVARLAGGDEVEGLDEEFLFHLNRGADLLTRGEAEPATTALGRALALRPKDAKVLGLLGQAYYKLGRYDDATVAWQRLVDDNPVEPGARVNLGLAFLKGKRYPEATKQLEIALDLNPDHKKAMGYLGLALLEAGDARKARDWFRKAGSDQMVARCDEILQGALRPVAAVSAPEPTPEPPAATPEPAPAPEPIHTPVPGTLAAVRPADPGAGLAAFAAAHLVRPPAGEPFAVSRGVLAVAVKGELRLRLEGLLATRGKLKVAPEQKRFRGRPTDQPFGEGARLVHRVKGDGLVLLRGAGRRFTVLDLGPEPAYLREETVFGFEEGLSFENGRVASGPVALDLVHLRGRGRFLLATAGEPVAVEVGADAPLRVPVEALVGWIGALTPRLVPLLDGDAELAVELAGEGRVLCDPGPGAARDGGERP